MPCGKRDNSEGFTHTAGLTLRTKQDSRQLVASGSFQTPASA